MNPTAEARPVLDPLFAPPFPQAALPVLRNPQLRKNVAHAIDVIQAKRAKLVAEKTDWQELRTAASAIRMHVLENLGAYLEQFEARCTAAGGVVHWAADAAEARRIILDLLRQENASEVIKIKTMTSAEIQLNPALEEAGISPFETDLAEIILQLGEEEPSHIVVPALHVNRSQVREIFARRMGLKNLSDNPKELTNAARTFLRQKFLTIPTAISGANFLIAETGSVGVVESEGNGRMCLTLPRTMITLAGIEKILPRFQDLEVTLQVLARSATGERMNPYTSLWTGVTPGDGPQRFHVVLLDNGRSSILAKPKQRQTLKCIRCAACMNACPVYRQTGGHAYGSVYPGPIGAILTPQLMHMKHAQSLPFASSLCGACYEVCPVKPRWWTRNANRLAASPTPCTWACASPTSSLPAPAASILRSGWAASASVSLPARTDGFTACPASAANGPRPATCAACPSKVSMSGGRRAARRQNERSR
jgi:L-lactate dehydrogenase complex protein LldF